MTRREVTLVALAAAHGVLWGIIASAFEPLSWQWFATVTVVNLASWFAVFRPLIQAHRNAA